MIRRIRHAALLIALLYLKQAQSSSTQEEADIIKNFLPPLNGDSSRSSDGVNNPLYLDDQDFWSRLVEEVISSSVVPETPPPAGRPTKAPTSDPTANPTKPPTPSATGAPSAPPAKAVTDSPTKSPTLAPTPVGFTPYPTPGPTPGPTPKPAIEPTIAPTEVPTPIPSQAPTDVCISEAEISCVDENGIPCDALLAPDGMCSSGDSLDVVRFRLKYCTCEESRNTQPTFEAGCEDAGPLPRPDDLVQITCTDPPDNTLSFRFNNVREGDEVTVEAESGNLPSTISCSLLNSDGDILQTVTIDTSGQVDLFLKDKYGSLELEACDNQDCISDVTYTYTSINGGPVPISITKFERTRNEDTIDLLPSISSTDIAPGGTGSTTETEPLDICSDGEYFTILEVEAIPSTGIVCPAETQYFISFEVACRMDVNILCTSEDGTDCTRLEPPPASCDLTDAPITKLKFRYMESLCRDSANSQGGSMCQDLGLPFPTGNTTVSCSPAEGGAELIVDPSTVSAGGTLMLTNPTGSTLPSEVGCTISDGATPIQEFSFFTSGGVDLDLKDRFGSFELLACHHNAGNSQDCEMLLSYIYELENVGTNDMDITLLERTRDGETKSLIDLLDMTTLSSGDETSAVEKVLIDVCLDETYTTAVEVEAASSTGITCFDEDDYTFETTIECKVDVKIKCQSETGIECTELGFPSVSCTAGSAPLTELTFDYEPCTCDDSARSNTQPDALCADFENPPDGAVDIACSSELDGSEVNVVPANLMPGDTLVLTMPDESPLPTEIRCAITTSDRGSATVFQVFSFFTEDSFDLKLHDKFASLKLLACQDETEQTLACDAVLSYEYELSNIGSNNMDIAVLDRTRNNITSSLLDLIQDTTVKPGDSVSVVEKEEVDLCTERPFTTTVVVEADPPGGVACFDEDALTFMITTPCDIFVELGCSTFGGIPCTALKGEQSLECECSDGCARELIYRYKGTLCNGLDGCTDTSPSEDAVDIVVQSGDTILFDDTLLLQENLVIRNNGACIPDVLDVTISPSGTQTPSQTLAIDSSCAGSVTLLEAFGALEFAGYTCEDNIPHNCYTDVEHSVITANVGTVSLNVTDWEFVLDGETKFPEIQLPVLEPKEEFSLSEFSEIELCTDTQYRSEVTATAVGASDGKTCEDTEFLNFDIVIGTQFPSPSPSDAPTGFPSGTPPPVPTTPSSSFPTSTPTTMPTQLPMSLPTGAPPPVVSPSPVTPVSAEPSGLTPEPTPESSPGSTPEPTPGSTSLEPTSTPSLPTPPLDPTLAPMGAPTIIPTTLPSRVPSALPTLLPITPTTTPTELATVLPSLQPTQECEFELDVTCVPPPGTESCNATPPPVEQCEGRPFEMVFLFNGGDCSQSYNVQEAQEKFTCSDMNEGVPTSGGEKAYIVVTDLDGDVVFHADWVNVGSLFILSDGGNDFPSDQLITIFNSEDTADANNMLQAVQYHSSCSQNLFLKDRFGAVQLVIWVNEDQGRVSCFANQTFVLDVTIPVDIEGGPATMESLTVSSNVQPFFFNLTDRVDGVVVDTGQSLRVVIVIPIDLTQQRTYNLLISLTAITAAGQLCGATELTSFSAGYPLPPIFPTFAPTQAPTGTNPPTPDPDEAICNLEADIDCQTGSGRSCRSLQAPSETVCSNPQDGQVSALDFLVTGNSCGTTDRCEDTNEGQNINDDEVFIFAEGDRGAIAFQGVATVGEFIRMDSGLTSGRLAITISSVVDGNAQIPGATLQVLDRVDLECYGEEGSLTLMQEFGALQLIGFVNFEQGINSIMEEVTMFYRVNNDGVLPATALSVVRTSAFEPGPVALVDESSPLQLEGDEEISFIEDKVQINLQDQVGQDFLFRLDVFGEGTQSGKNCTDSDLYIFRVEQSQ